MIKTFLARYINKNSCKCTVKQLSEYTGIPESTLKEYIYNTKEMTLTDLVSITGCLGISLDKFIDVGRSSKKYPDNKVSCLRADNQLTQMDLANALGVFQTNISSLEVYKYNKVSSYVLGDIAEFFGLSADYILGYIPDKIEIDKSVKTSYSDKFFTGPRITVGTLIRYAELQKKSLDEVFGFKRKGDNVTKNDENKIERTEEEQ